MPPIFKPAAMALAAAGLTLTVPARAADLPGNSTAAYPAVTGDMVFEHGPKHKNKHKRKHAQRSHRYDRDYRDARYDDRRYEGRYDDRRYDDRRYDDRRYDDRRYDDRRYNDRYSYRGSAQPYYNNYGQPVRRDTRIWRGDDGRYYCRKDNGTTGLLVGAGVGALLGHEVAGRGDRTLGAVLGGAAGALLGRTIDRSSTRCG